MIARALRAKAALDTARWARWLERLRERGMRIGEDVFLPPSTAIDLEYCHMITVGDSCSFGAEVLLLPQDALAGPFLGAVRAAPIVLHESCHIGARAILMPGIEIGPRTIVAACSVVTRSLPPDSVCAGNPARPFSSLARYLESHRARLTAAARFSYADYGTNALTPERRAEIVAAASTGDTYVTGGRTAELQGIGGTPRTPTLQHRPVPPAPTPRPTNAAGSS